MKPRITVDDVLGLPAWAVLRAELGLPPVPSPAPSRDQVRRRLTGIGMRRGYLPAGEEQA